MFKLAGVLFVQLLSIVSVVRLYLSIPAPDGGRPWWHLAAITAVCMLIAAVIVWEIINYFRSAPTSIRFCQKKRIKRYMRNLIDSGGRVVIFTRDMTWADDRKVRDTLSRKAKNGELLICIEKSIDLTVQLAKEGAEIITYGELGVVPRSRYTIVGFEKDSARVAVGGAIGGAHVIQEFRNGDHPFFSVAEDLVRILIARKRTTNGA